MKTYITRNEAANHAGVSPRTIDRWRAEGLLTTHRVRHRFVCIDPDELNRLVRPEQADR